MEEKTSRILLRVLLLAAITSQLLTSGCATTQQPTPPEGEGKEPAEVVKPEPMPPPPTVTQPVEKPAPPPQMSSPVPAPSASQPPPLPEARQHPVLTGEILLDPAVSRDAQMIQSRLAELGLYKGAIDGIWGRGSRAALRAFKERYALGDPETWNRETQILLFRGADLNPQAIPESGRKPISSGLTLLDPAVSRDAQMIQSRLAELGLYKGAIDGIWGRGSRAALRAFKERNALGDPETWNRETQILLFRETSK